MTAFDHWAESLAAQTDDHDEPTRRELDFEEAAVKAERGREWWADIPEPPELIAQTAALAAQRAHNEIRCADCDRPRWAHGLTSYVRMADGSLTWVGCRFVEPPS